MLTAQEGQVTHLFIARQPGEPMIPVPGVRAVALRGLKGDRYFRRLVARCASSRAHRARTALRAASRRCEAGIPRQRARAAFRAPRRRSSGVRDLR